MHDYVRDDYGGGIEGAVQAAYSMSQTQEIANSKEESSQEEMMATRRGVNKSILGGIAYKVLSPLAKAVSFLTGGGAVLAGCGYKPTTEEISLDDYLHNTTLSAEQIKEVQEVMHEDSTSKLSYETAMACYVAAYHSKHGKAPPKGVKIQFVENRKDRDGTYNPNNGVLYIDEHLRKDPLRLLRVIAHEGKHKEGHGHGHHHSHGDESKLRYGDDHLHRVNGKVEYKDNARKYVIQELVAESESFVLGQHLLRMLPFQARVSNEDVRGRFIYGGRFFVGLDYKSQRGEGIKNRLNNTIKGIGTEFKEVSSFADGSTEEERKRVNIYHVADLVNHWAASVLYKKALKQREKTGRDTKIDVYSGDSLAKLVHLTAKVINPFSISKSLAAIENKLLGTNIEEIDLDEIILNNFAAEREGAKGSVFLETTMEFDVNWFVKDESVPPAMVKIKPALVHFALLESNYKLKLKGTPHLMDVQLQDLKEEDYRYLSLKDLTTNPFKSVTGDKEGMKHLKR